MTLGASSMDINSAEGAVKEVAGKVQEALGDTSAQVAGKARELSGKAQQLCASTTSLVRETTAESPFTTIAVVALAGFVGRTAFGDRPVRLSYAALFCVPDFALFTALFYAFFYVPFHALCPSQIAP
jgi:uncharacterized protein YjbJ (UPF0337 family)